MNNKYVVYIYNRIFCILLYMYVLFNYKEKYKVFREIDIIKNKNIFWEVY